MKKDVPRISRKKQKLTYMHQATRLEGVVKNRGIRNVKKPKQR